MSFSLDFVNNFFFTEKLKMTRPAVMTIPNMMLALLRLTLAPFLGKK